MMVRVSQQCECKCHWTYMVKLVHFVLCDFTTVIYIYIYIYIHTHTHTHIYTHTQRNSDWNTTFTGKCEEI